MKRNHALIRYMGLAALLLSMSASAAEGDLILPADKIALKDGRAMVSENSHYNVRTLRVELPPNQEMQPHGPKEGYFIATVMSGTLQLGLGKNFDAAQLQTLPPGSIFTHSPEQQHFARTGKEPVVLQLTSIKPIASASTAKSATHEH